MKIDKDQIPNCHQHLFQTEFGKCFTQAIEAVSFDGGDAKVRIMNVSGNPDVLYVYIIPAESGERIHADHSYIATSFPILTRGMFEHYKSFQPEFDLILERFIADLVSKNVVERKDISNIEYDEILCRFDQSLPI